MEKQELNGNLLVNIVVSNSCNLVKLRRNDNHTVFSGKLIFCLLVSIVWTMNVLKMYSQDPSFSQPYANKLVLNPAFAGESECPQINLGYRNHLPETGAFNTYIVSYQSYFSDLSSGIGFVFLNDSQGNGVFSKYSITASYSYHFQLSKNVHFSAGLEAGLMHRNRNTSGLIFPDMLDPFQGIQAGEENISALNRNIFDISTGFLASFRKFFFGFAIHHLTQPNESISHSAEIPLRRKYTLHAGTTVPIGSGRNIGGLITRGQWAFLPTIIFQNQGESTILSYGLYVTLQEISLGTWLKQEFYFNDFSMTFLAGYSGDSYSFAYSYDFGYNVSGLALPEKGSHELSVGIKLPCVDKRKKIRAVKCPNF